VNFGRVQRLPIVLAGLLATLGIAVFTYLLTTSVRRRRRDLAVLKALGFARREVRVVLGAQATVVAAITAFVGVPLGIVAGRIAWVALAGRLGVPARPVVELPVIALIVVFTMVTANIVGAIPGFFAARVRPATVLRTK
jgi:putative ABC transport system permease protein